MLSAALRAPPPPSGPAGGGLPNVTAAVPIQQPRLPASVFGKVAPVSAASSLTEDGVFFQQLDSPRPLVVADETDDEADAHEEQTLFALGDGSDDCGTAQASSSSSASRAVLSGLHSPDEPAKGPLASESMPIARLLGARSQDAGLAELEHVVNCGGSRGSRPITIRKDFAATYQPTAGRYMQFIPPHELAAASMNESEAMFGGHSQQRHKSAADRLRSAMFEQTGFMSMSNAAAFLHSSAAPHRAPEAAARSKV